MLKKTLLSLAIFSAMNAAIAGGPSFMSMPSNDNNAVPRFYIDGNFGLAWQDWTSVQDQLLDDIPPYTSLSSPTNSLTWSNGSNRFSFGFAAGWHILSYLAFEAGWYTFANTAFEGTATASSTNYNLTGVIKSWMAYFGLKVTLLQNNDDSLRAFGKVGIAYSHNTFEWTFTPSASSSGSVDTNIWSPIFAVGGTVDLTENVYASVQMIYIVEGTSNYAISSGAVEFKQPATEMGMLTLGARF